MKRNRLIMLILAAALTLNGCGAVVQKPEESEAAEEAIVEVKPEEIRAQDDFYGYINAGSLMETDLDELKRGAGGSFQSAVELVDEQLDGIIKEIADGSKTYREGSNEQLIRDVYMQELEASTGGSFMDEKDIESMNEVVGKIMAAEDIGDFLELCGELESEWEVNPVFGTRVDADIKNSSAGSIQILPFESPVGGKLKQLAVGGENAQGAAAGIRRVLLDQGAGSDEAKERSLNCIRLIMDIAYDSDHELSDMIAKDWMKLMQFAIYRTNEEIDELCPNVGIDGILRSMGIKRRVTDGVYLLDEKQLATIDSLLTEEHLQEWKDIAAVSFIQSLGDMLPKEYGGMPMLFSNDKYALQQVKMKLAKELGEEYVKRYYDSEAVEAVTKMTDDIVKEYIVMIDGCEWLSAAGKKAIKEKLENMRYFIGAELQPDGSTDTAFTVGDTVYETTRNIHIRDHGRRIKLLEKGMERNGFERMAPMTVNACYLPEINSINITMAIINSRPFYDKDASYAANLGGIGAVIGHEISHAFDDHGMMYDKDGNYRPEWISEADRRAFDEMADKVAAYYSGQLVLKVHPVDGRKTLGENLADISGLDCVLRLAENDSQRREIFESYAKIWSGICPKDAGLSQLHDDVHSPEKIRVNAVVPLFDAFYEIYDVHEGDAMYLAPEDRVRRW
ncbi:MAG: M13 family metallopeptidase [Lachnospiraceae bacterium]|nr:M13 family metallopeptidase [Lachnospiraceae bacterium]